MELFLIIEESCFFFCINKCYNKILCNSTEIMVGTPSQGMQEVQSNSSSLDIVSWTQNFSHSSLYAGCLVAWVCWWCFCCLFFFCHHYALDLKCKQKYKLHVYYVETYLEGLIERMDISVFLIIPIQCFPASYVSLLQVFSKGCSPYVSPAFSQVRSWLEPVGH